MNEAVSKVLANLGLDADPFKQVKVIELVKNPLSGAWVTVYSHHDAADGRPSVFACFADLTKKEEILAGDDWLKNALSFSPGFCMYRDDVTYHNGRDEGYDFIVAEQYFYPLDQAQILVNQEFIMLFELYRSEDGCYYSVDRCGEREKVVDFAEDEVRVRTKYMLRFIRLSNVSSSTLWTRDSHLRPAFLWGALSAFQRVMRSGGITISGNGTRAMLMKATCYRCFTLEALSSPATSRLAAYGRTMRRKNGTLSSSSMNDLTVRSFDTHATRISLAPTLKRSLALHIT